MLRLSSTIVPLTLWASLALAQGNGRGDPPTVRASGLQGPWAVIADPYGDFIVSEAFNGRVWWVTTDGRKQVITTGLTRPIALGWDVYANLLIVAANFVYKLNPKGEVSVFIPVGALEGVALDADGTLWFTEPAQVTPALRHYDALGKPIEVINLTLFGDQSGPNVIATSRSGDVFFTSNGAAGGTTVYRLVNKQAQRLFNLSWRVLGMAVDASGNLYLSGGETGNSHVAIYSQSGTPIADPYASQFNGNTGIAFGRNSDGSMNRRLFVVDQGGRFLELNSSADQPGAPVGFATSTQAIGDLLRPGPLSSAQRRILDQLGNNNGSYDVGDLRAFLIQTTTLSASGAMVTAGGHYVH